MERKKVNKESLPDKEGQESLSDKAKKEGAGSAVNRFTKGQLLSSARFRDRRDLLDALLSPEGLYSIAEAEQEMKKYRKGKVK